MKCVARTYMENTAGKGSMDLLYWDVGGDALYDMTKGLGWADPSAGLIQPPAGLI